MKTSRKLLICAASPGELMGSLRIASKAASMRPGCITSINGNADALICGVGMFQAEYHLMKALSGHGYALVMAAGVAGAYSTSTPLGKAFMVDGCAFADCAMEGPQGQMVPVVGSSFIPEGSAPFCQGAIPCPASARIAAAMGLECARANTVNRIITSRQHLGEMLALHPAQLETMESAALAYACAMENVEYAEIRCVSNHALPKSEQKWMIKPAIANLGAIIDSMLDKNCKKIVRLFGAVSEKD